MRKYVISKFNKIEVRKILHVIHGGSFGGVESVVLNYYQNIDRNRFQFDFVFHSSKKLEFHEEIEKLGGRVFIFPTLGSNPWQYFKKLRLIIQQNGKYDAIHIHTGHQSGFVAFFALFSGIKIRICHSHNITAENPLHRKLFSLWRLVIAIFCNKFIACSDESGKIWFRNLKFELLPNAINFEKYQNVDIKEVIEFKEELGITSNSLIMGHAGRFVKVKNHDYLIEIVSNIINKYHRNVHLLLAGDGPLFNEIKEKTIMYGLERNIHFLGHFSNMPLFWNSIDVMLLPSHNEGFPLVFVEAQAAGKYSIISDGVKSVLSSGFSNYSICELSAIDTWCEKILKHNGKFVGYVSDNNIYNLDYSAKSLEIGRAHV